ncbi:MAG: putative toxin-antitoxin system toxin component, PIN family [Flavobacteriales bacterium]|nr:putative toxin-antitoxin system toxin component, PIN family [Flavobacteriales bacterium]
MRQGKRKPLKVIVDVKVLFSFLIGKRLKGFVTLLMVNHVQVLVSTELLDELKEVLQRPHLRRYFTQSEAIEFAVIFEHLGQHVDIDLSEEVSISRDPKDDYLLRMAKQSKADVLVTGDKDLLVLGKFGSTQILNARTFSEDHLRV